MAPQELLESLLTLAVPNRSDVSRATVQALARMGGDFGKADDLAREVGCRNRQALARVLLADGMPPLTELTGWVRILSWMIEVENTGLSLASLSLRASCDPASRYRTVRRITGRSWSDVRRFGTSWILFEFLSRCYRPLEQKPEDSAERPRRLGCA